MSKYQKYPRTFHLPWSQSIKSDDKVCQNPDMFIGKKVVVTYKIDGENTSIYGDGFCHARSLDSRYHWSRSWIKRFSAQISHRLPNGWRICGENMYAVHSIKYEQLDSYFYGFSMWSLDNNCLSYDSTVDWFKNLGIEHVPVIYYGIYNETAIRAIEIGNHEGYVIRVADEFHYDDFSLSVAKFVRANHVKTDQHWMHKRDCKKINILRGE